MPKKAHTLFPITNGAHPPKRTPLCTPSVQYILPRPAAENAVAASARFGCSWRSWCQGKWGRKAQWAEWSSYADRGVDHCGYTTSLFSFRTTSCSIGTMALVLEPECEGIRAGGCVLTDITSFAKPCKDACGMARGSPGQLPVPEISCAYPSSFETSPFRAQQGLLRSPRNKDDQPPLRSGPARGYGVRKFAGARKNRGTPPLIALAGWRGRPSRRVRVHRALPVRRAGYWTAH